MCMSKCGCVHMDASAHPGQKRELHPPELELNKGGCEKPLEEAGVNPRLPKEQHVQLTAEPLFHPQISRVF